MPNASIWTPITDSGEESYILQPPLSVAFSVNHPLLLSTTPRSIRIFLRHYDQYVKEVTTRALQLTMVDSTTIEPVRPVNLLYCVDAEWLESTVDLEYIPEVKKMEDLTDEKL